MADISKIKLPGSDVIHNIKDTVARQGVADNAAEIEKLKAYTKFIGVVDKAKNDLKEGDTTNPIYISGKEEAVDVQSGDIAINGTKEFIFDGTTWQEFGDLSAITDILGDFAYVDEGTVTVSGTAEDSAVSIADDGSVEEFLTSATTATVSVPGVKTTNAKLSAEVSTEVAIDVATSTEALTALGDPTTTNIKTYTVSNKALATDSASVLTKDATLPSWTAAIDEEDNELLVFDWSAGEAATFDEVTVATGSLVDEGAEGAGDSVTVDIDESEGDAVVTGYTPSSDTFAQTIEVTTQPAVTIATGESGDVDYVTGLEEDDASTIDVDFSEGTVAEAITAIGTLTAAGQAYSGTYDVTPKTVNNEDKA